MADFVTKGLLALINTKSAITAELGDRIYPQRLKQGTAFPAATYRIISQIGNRTFDGASTYDFNHIEFQIYSSLSADVQRIVELLRKELEDVKGTFNGVIINAIVYMDSGGGRVSGADDYLGDLEKFTKSIEFKIDTRRNP